MAVFQLASVVIDDGFRVVVNCIVGKVGLLVVLNIGPMVDCLMIGRLENKGSFMMQNYIFKKRRIVYATSLLAFESPFVFDLD